VDLAPQPPALTTAITNSDYRASAQRIGVQGNRYNGLRPGLVGR
jgi:hypothetical protein